MLVEGIIRFGYLKFLPWLLGNLIFGPERFGVLVSAVYSLVFMMDFECD